jgi:hypothetical protein
MTKNGYKLCHQIYGFWKTKKINRIRHASTAYSQNAFFCIYLGRAIGCIPLGIGAGLK